MGFTKFYVVLVTSLRQGTKVLQRGGLDRKRRVNQVAELLGAILLLSHIFRLEVVWLPVL